MKMNKKGQDDIISVLFVIGLVCIIIFVFIGLRVVDYNEYAIEKEYGHIKGEIRNTGINFIGIGSLIRTNNQIRNYEISVEGASNDFQDVIMTLNLNIRINKDKVVDFIKDYQNEELFNQYLNNKVQEKVKQILLKYSAEDMLLQRDKVRQEMYDAVIEINELKYFTFNDLTIKNIAFSEEFTEMLEKRASVNQEREIIIKQKENLELLKKNIDSIDIDKYFKYELINKWDGKSTLVVGNIIGE